MSDSLFIHSSSNFIGIIINTIFLTIILYPHPNPTLISKYYITPHNIKEENKIGYSGI